MTHSVQSRRQFIRRLLGSGAALGGVCLVASAEPTTRRPDVVVARGGSVPDRLLAALRPLGGIERFVKRGSVVVIKPNAAFNEPPETGGNTTPEVVAAMVRACRAAGAARVIVTEHSLSNRGLFGTDNDPSGISQAAKGAGAQVIDAGTRDGMYLPVRVDAPGIRSHPVNAYVLQADVVINVPRLKTHPVAGYTLSTKNLMGALLRPIVFHAGSPRRLPERLAHLGRVLQRYVHLTVIDASHIVRGWAAGRPGRLERADGIIAGTSMVSTDAIGTTLFGEDPIGRWKCATGDSYLRIAHERGWGVADPRGIERVDVKL